MNQTPNEVHVMIDFETLGLRSDAVVLSLGAAVFIPSLLPHEDGVDFYQEASVNQYHRAISSDILIWWESQAPGLMPKSDQSLLRLTNKFHTFLTFTLAHRFPGHELILWSNGTDFDIPILYSIYDEQRLTPPWKYDNVRDYRTLRKTFPIVEAAPFVGRKHNAYDDAWNEAAHCVRILSYLADRSKEIE